MGMKQTPLKGTQKLQSCRWLHYIYVYMYRESTRPVLLCEGCNSFIVKRVAFPVTQFINNNIVNLLDKTVQTQKSVSQMHFGCFICILVIIVHCRSSTIICLNNLFLCCEHCR